MKVTWLSLVLFPFVLTDKLDEDRRSCGKSKIAYIADGKIWNTKPIFLDNPGLEPEDWDRLIRHECEEKRSVLAIKSRVGYLQQSSLNLKDILDILKNKVLLTKYLENLWNRKAFRLKFAIDSTEVKDETVQLEVLEWLKTPSFSIGCSDDKITVKLNELPINIPSFDFFGVRQCGDIGEDLGDAYEFYNVSSSWTYESGDATYQIKEELCQQTNTTLMCPENAAELMSCSLNSIEHCKLDIVINDPKSPSTSYVRLLPGGVAVYGTFERQLDLYENITAVPLKIEPGLYYFRYSQF